jgi:hypothetical protein
MTETPAQTDAPTAIGQLSSTLDRIGDALVSVDVDALLAAEASLAPALSALAVLESISDPEATVAACRRARTALLRCRRLGASFSNIAHSFSRVGSLGDGYDRVGAYVPSAGAATALRVRI